MLQGERPLARDNRTLGRFHLVGIPPAPRGVPQIEVTFDIDANGIVNVSAKDLGTGKEQKITITASSGLSKDEVDRMMKDAESHADEDKKRREEIETRNRADQAVYGAERMLKDTGDKLGAGDKAAIEAAIEAVKKASEGNDAAAIEQGAGAVDAGAAQGGRGALQAAGAGAGGGGPAGAPGGGAAGARARPAAAARAAATSSTRRWWTTRGQISRRRIHVDGPNRLSRKSESNGSVSDLGRGARRDAERHQARVQAAGAPVSTRTSIRATARRRRSSGRSPRRTRRSVDPDRRRRYDTRRIGDATAPSR